MQGGLCLTSPMNCVNTWKPEEWVRQHTVEMIWLQAFHNLPEEGIRQNQTRHISNENDKIQQGQTFPRGRKLRDTSE